jgi:hypothetical protein
MQHLLDAAKADTFDLWQPHDLLIALAAIWDGFVFLFFVI